MKPLLLCLATTALALLPAPICAQAAPQPGSMSVATFLVKAEALKAKGMMAAFSSDIGLLKAEVTGSARAFRAQVKTEAATGKPSACPPEHAAINSDELISHMQGYPAAARARIPVSQAVGDLLRKRFPCPAR